MNPTNWQCTHVDTYISRFRDVTDGCWLLITRGTTPDWFSLSLPTFFAQSLSCNDVGCCVLQVLHVCLSLQCLATCWSLKQPTHSFFSSTNSHCSFMGFFKNCSQSFKLWGFLHKEHNKDCLVLPSCFNPVARFVPFPPLRDILLNLTWVPLSFSSWWGSVTFSSENTESVASWASSQTNYENSSKSAILPFAILVLLFLSVHLLRRCLGNFSQSCRSTWAVFKSSMWVMPFIADFVWSIEIEKFYRAEPSFALIGFLVGSFWFTLRTAINIFFSLTWSGLTQKMQSFPGV